METTSANYETFTEQEKRIWHVLKSTLPMHTTVYVIKRLSTPRIHHASFYAVENGKLIDISRWIFDLWEAIEGIPGGSYIEWCGKKNCTIVSDPLGIPDDLGSELHGVNNALKVELLA